MAHAEAEAASEREAERSSGAPEPGKTAGAAKVASSAPAARRAGSTAPSACATAWRFSDGDQDHELRGILALDIADPNAP